MSALRIVSISAGLLCVSALGVYFSASNGVPEAEAAVRAAPAIEAAAPEAAAESSDETQVAQRRRRGDSDDFEVIADLSVESDNDAPRVCLRFSQPLKSVKDVNYGDYLRFEPKIAASYVARGKRLCVEGPQHGQSYRVTLLKGLASASGKKYEETEDFTVSVPDRKPTMNFGGAAYILPRGGKREIALESVNVDKAKVSVVRINDRNLIQEINQGRIAKLLSRYDIRNIASTSGEEIWKGTLEIEKKLNKKVMSAIVISDILKDPKPGIYAIMAMPADATEHRYYGNSEATQWFVVSDLGLSTYRGANGLHVFVRSLASAKPRESVVLRLIARNNEVLGEAVTDGKGAASFAPGLMRGTGGAKPAAVMAYGTDDDFNVHDISRPAFDLTDRGVGGRGAPGPIDAFLYSERGVYRPGETVHLVALLRDNKADAVTGPPLTLKLFKPNGTEHRKFTLKSGDAGGGHQLDIELSPAARTGQWTVRAYVDPKGRSVGSTGFKVEDFAPERMEVTLKPEKKQLTPKSDNNVEVDAQFLYGAPAAGLAVEGEVVLQQDMNPYPKHRGFRFGLVQEEWRAKRQELPGGKTDDKGKAQLTVRLDKAPDTSRPLRAVVRASVSEAGGRAVSRTVNLPVRTAPFAIGVRPQFGDRWVGIKSEAAFDVIAVGHDGATMAANALEYELINEDYDYRWYYRGGEWGYKILINETSAKSGKFSVDSGTPKKLSFRLDWGRYRLEVHDKKTNAATSVRFQVGWFASAMGADVPDKLEIALDKPKYAAGETAKVHVRPPFAGEVLLTVAGAELYMARNFSVPKEGKTVELPVERDWDAGAYVTATVFRPANKQTERQPARAIGVVWLGRDMSDRKLRIKVDAPDKITPRQEIKLGIAVEGATSGQAAHVTVAAVDEGILQLTRFRTPAPDDHYFGKRRLAVELRDDYGRLIKSAKGQRGRLRQGGDAAAKKHLGGLDASSIKTVALFSGNVRLDANGRASVPLAIPDFNGRLRLMVVAYDKTRVGHTERPLTVRDQLVSQLTLPRFLAPRDAGRATLSLHNVDGAVGDYTIDVKATGAAKIAGGNGKDTVRLARDGRKTMRFGIEGAAVGVANISLSIKGPKDFSVNRKWRIAVRPAQAVTTENIARRLDPGKTIAFTDDLIEKFVPGTGDVLLSFSRHPDMGVADLLKSLSRYPYGCAEQTTSRAMPLLYVGEVAKSVGIAENETVIRSRVQKAIGRLFTMQRSDGSFGMWSSRDRREDWLSAYVMDFMTQAKKKGYLVPEFAYKRGMQWLQSRIMSGNFRENYLPVAAYAHYVLASANQADMASLRYFHDNYIEEIPTMLGRAQVGAALGLEGDRERARNSFAAVPKAQSVWQSFFGIRRNYYYYGSDLREAAGVVYLAAASNTYKNELPNLVSALNKLREERKYLSTQEKAWLLRVAAALQTGDPMEIALNGKRLGARTKPFYLSANTETLAKRVKVENRGGEALWQNVTITGVPADDLDAEESGFAISREFYTLDGKRADLKKVRQSDVLVAVINGEATKQMNHQALIVDLLPAGFEIENERLTGGRGNDEMGWLPKLTRTRHTEKRDDRYVAAVDLHRRNGEFSLAYIVRAVTPGTFRLPAVYVEDMYKPQYFARSQMGTVTILPR